MVAICKDSKTPEQRNQEVGEREKKEKKKKILPSVFTQSHWQPVTAPSPANWPPPTSDAPPPSHRNRLPLHASPSRPAHVQHQTPHGSTQPHTVAFAPTR